MKNILLPALIIALVATPLPVCAAAPSAPGESKTRKADAKELRKHLDLAAAYLEMLEPDKAFLHYEAALMIDPQNKEAKDGLEQVERCRAQYYPSYSTHCRFHTIQEQEESTPAKKD